MSAFLMDSRSFIIGESPTDYPDWSLNEGHHQASPRGYDVPLAFNTVFEATPTVSLSLSGFICEDGSTGTGVILTAVNVGTQGFTLRIEATKGTKLARVYGTWVAAGIPSQAR